jgi:hypothetical protein
MTQLYCLVGFAAWAVILVASIASLRTLEVLMGKKRSNEFPSGTQHGGDRYWRLNRAHVNTVENLPIFGALVLTATLLHVDVLRWAEIALCARILQSVIHVSSNSVIAVNLRFTAFVTQMVCYVGMIWKLGAHWS